MNKMKKVITILGVIIFIYLIWFYIQKRKEAHNALIESILSSPVDSNARARELKEQQEKKDRDFWRSMGYDMGPEGAYAK
jgi:hypothetical protein